MKLSKTLSSLLIIAVAFSTISFFDYHKEVKAATSDWLTTDGDKVIDQNGNEVWLTGVNWFGYNTGTNIFDGVWSCNMKSALQGIADHGFNLLRIPMSAELLLQWSRGEYPVANYNSYLNPELEGKNSLEIFDYALEICDGVGIKVMIDIHSAKTDAMGHNYPLWFTDSISTEQYLAALDWVSNRYKNNDTVVAYDLKNEPHGQPNETHAIWNGSSDDNNWKYIAEKAGNTVLDNNPNVLIVIEGIEVYPKNGNSYSTNSADYYFAWWGGNLRGVKDYPIDFGSSSRNKQIIYSPHDYGPSVYQQPWFHSGYNYQSLIDEYWYDNWLYIDDQKIAPILIGEWGGYMSSDNLVWMTHLRSLINNYHLNYTFWCYNANSGDTGGLIQSDFNTWDDEKYNFVKEVLWKNSEGKFVGLDHETPLGSNGISLNQYYGNTGSGSPNIPTSVPTPTTKPTKEVPMNPEGTYDFVERLYSVTLNRTSDEKGKNDWVNRIRNGLTAAECANGFLYSPEFLNKGLSDSDFLDVLYKVFFDRKADNDGKNYWLNRMKNGLSKDGVIAGFVNSTEWANLCLIYGIKSGGTGTPDISVIPSEKVIGFVNRLYSTCLNRDADPKGLTDWAYKLANHKVSGTTAAYGFIFSEEFINAGYSNEEFINRLYRTFMGREADSNGFNDWLTKLNKGASRKSVFDGFANSKEFKAICADYGIICN